MGNAPAAVDIPAGNIRFVLPGHQNEVASAGIVRGLLPGCEPVHDTVVNY